ncbi:MAG: universal stress protein [Bacteroidetes bacterium]|nr:universal stress protein [Fibrella sp.]
MKTIVLATDLSDTAVPAADYAHELAQKLHARLVIVHAYEPASDTIPDRIAIPVRLTRIRQRLMRISKGSVDIAVIAKAGKPLAGIQTTVAEQEADLLIIALTGPDPLSVRSLGSLTTYLIPQTSVPMLILPPGVRYEPVRNIVLTLDLSDAVDAGALGNARALTQALGATLDIICMNDEPDQHQQEAARQIQEWFSDLTHTFSFWSGNDLTITLDDYFMHHRADLIMMLPRHRSRFDTWLNESVTQQVVRQAVVPVLAVV